MLDRHRHAGRTILVIHQLNRTYHNAANSQLAQRNLQDVNNPMVLFVLFQALEREAAAIRAKLPPSTSLVCLCVEGRLRSSEELSTLVGTWEHSSAKHLAFVIGGSYGLAERLKGESWVKLSMSPMTFPHHLARGMVLEQVYRASQIAAGTRYHK